MHTLEILHARWIPKNGRKDPLIVEIGTSESYNPNGLGNALLAFAWYAGRYGARVRSVDVWEGAVQNSRDILRKYVPEYADLPEIFCADAFDWVTEIHEPIDLLYMDAGFEICCEPNYKAFAARYADRIPSFYLELYGRFPEECFPAGSLMLWDDTNPDSFDGKGVIAIPVLLSLGWRKMAMRGEPVFPMVLLEKT